MVGCLSQAPSKLRGFQGTRFWTQSTKCLFLSWPQGTCQWCGTCTMMECTQESPFHPKQQWVYNYDFAIIKTKHGCGFQKFSRVIDEVCPNHILEFIKVKCQYKITLNNIHHLYTHCTPNGFANVQLLICKRTVLENTLFIMPTSK